MLKPRTLTLKIAERITRLKKKFHVELGGALNVLSFWDGRVQRVAGHTGDLLE